MPKLANLPLTFKIPALGVTLLALSMVGIAFVTQSDTRAVTHSKGAQVIEARATADANAIGAQVGSISDGLVRLAGTPRIAAALDGTMPLGGPEIAALSQSYGFDSLAVLAKGRVIATVSELGEGERAIAEQAVATSGPSYAEVLRGEGTGSILVGVPIEGAAGAALVAEIPASTLGALVASEADRVEGFSLRILGANGMALYASEGAGALSSEATTRLMSQEPQAFDRLDADARGYITVGRAIGVPGIDWTLVLDRSLSSLFAPVDDMMRAIALKLGVIFLISAAICFVMARGISQPIRGMVEALNDVANGDLDTENESADRKDEVGQMAQALSALRHKLREARDIERDAAMKGAAFQGSAVPTVLTDAETQIVFVNGAMKGFWSEHEGRFEGATQIGGVEKLAGHSLAQLDEKLRAVRGAISESASDQVTCDIVLADRVFQLTCTAIKDADKTPEGFVVEFQDATSERANSAMISAIEANLVTARLSASGDVQFCNPAFAALLAKPKENCIGTPILESVSEERSDGSFSQIASALRQGKAVSGTFKLRVHSTEERWLVGGFSPILGGEGDIDGHVVVGMNVSDTRAQTERETARRNEMEKAQAHVVETLRNALKRLAEGDLTVKIDEPLGEAYEQLRTDFNVAATKLLDAIVAVIDNADTMSGEIGEITRAADDLSKRTEHQAATLEETASSLDLLTKSVTSSAQGATTAKDVVDKASTSAKQSGVIVKQAVEAMTEISKSSDGISKIIDVIDEISFQTNLLALNAGVEAARAGDAGKGFAVVASEVRALAQRSSEAAQEISNLISVSGANVGRGVDLVNETGDALNEIVHRVSSVAELVSEIVASAQDQSTNLAEINESVTQLDRVTQQNAAMFEQTSAASQTLAKGAKMLSGTTATFQTGSRKAKEKAVPGTDVAKAPTSDVGRLDSKSVGHSKPAVSFTKAVAIKPKQPEPPVMREPQKPMPTSSPRLMQTSKTAASQAVAAEEFAFEDDDGWQEF